MPQCYILAMDGTCTTEEDEDEGGEGAVAVATAEVGSGVAEEPNEDEY